MEEIMAYFWQSLRWDDENQEQFLSGQPASDDDNRNRLIQEKKPEVSTISAFLYG
jgi:hypothetical protein